MYLAERARAFDNLFANSITFPGVTPHPFVVIGSYSSSISRNRRRTFVTGSGVEAVAIFSEIFRGAWWHELCGAVRKRNPKQYHKFSSELN